MNPTLHLQNTRLQSTAQDLGTLKTDNEHYYSMRVHFKCADLDSGSTEVQQKVCEHSGITWISALITQNM